MTASAAIYLRISEDRTGEEAGVTRQREDCERRAMDRGWDVVAVEQDNDVSAKGRQKRPGFERVLQLIEDGAVQVVIAWHLDRLQRNRRDEVRLYELCEKRKVVVSLVRGPDLEWETPTGRYLADNLGSLARLEIEQKSDRQKRAQAQAAQAGRRVGGRKAFGYTLGGTEVIEEEAAAVYDGYRALLAGEPLAEIARDWNSRGLTTGQRGNSGERKDVPSPFTRSSVRDVLLNPRNAALRSHVTEEDRERAREERRRVYACDHVVGPATWPPIVDEGTWRAAVDLLRDPRRRTAPANARALLTGVARCGTCGDTVHSGGAAMTQPLRIYRCRSMKHVSRAAEPVEAYVSAVVVSRLSRPDAADLLTDESKPDVGKLREKAVALRTRLDGAAQAFAAGAIELSQLTRITEDIKTRLTEVENELADAGRVDVLGPLVSSADVQAAWDRMSTARRRAVVDLLMVVRLHPPGRGTRTFRPESVEIEWVAGA
ncbi:recombinase family protein [Blastococcus sp. TBT05-19]|uniref:recombinase family protein n=1 Tax=Blastococcus sp. TBT05-19 TaxID=2250581 RepID=UPI00131438C6|nr:recombinase family protein [Blastococcus sp. TBT05-19]